MALCPKCNQEVDVDDLYLVNGQEICEDCAMEQQSTPKACDVWAVRIAKNTREQMGMQETEGLSELQQAIYNFIKHKNGVTMEELQQEFDLTEKEILKEVAVLRHCELGRAHKKGNEKYYVPWDYKDDNN